MLLILYIRTKIQKRIGANK